MKINGEIGQEILLSGKIKKIMVDEDGMVEYCVNVSGSVEYCVNVSGSGFSFWLHAADIVFKTLGEVVDEDDFRKEYPDRFPDRIVEELKAENATDCDNTATVEEYNDELIPDSASGLPIDDEWSRPATKKRGRPRKATVDDLMKRAKE